MKSTTFLSIFLLFASLILSTTSCEIKPPYDGYSVVRLTFDNEEQKENVLNKLEQICAIKHVEDERTDPNADFVELIVNFEQLKKAQLLMSHKSIRVLMGDLGATIKHETAAFVAPPKTESDKVCTDDTCSATALVAGEVDMEYYKKYRTYEDFLERWEILAQTYSEFVKLETIGSTIEGRKIHMFRIGKTDEENPKRIMIDAMQHAREWIVSMAALYSIESLAAKAYLAKKWFTDVELLIVPLLNPDGYVYSHTDDRMWRKNRNPRNSCRGEPAGVDLNRNWGTDFGGKESTSKDPCSDIFTGPEAFSELESQAIRKLFKETEGIKVHLDVHSFSELVLGPWSHKDDTPPRADEIDIVGNLLNEKLNSGGKSYYYARGKNDHIYLASGVMTDWVFEANNVLSYTYELRPKRMWEGGFMLPAREIVPNCKEFHLSVGALIEYVSENM